MGCPGVNEMPGEKGCPLATKSRATPGASASSNYILNGIKSTEYSIKNAIRYGKKKDVSLKVNAVSQ
jgi:hypothetical protein